MNERFSPHLKLAKKLWKDFLNTGDLAIDATCGNGHDTCFLACLCHCIGIDIQSQAIENTKKRLANLSLQADLFLLSHERIDELNVNPKLIVYNLGYLPGSDKSITTQSESTLNSVKKAIQMIQKGGAISIMCYPGHDQGWIETKALKEWILKLDLKRFEVQHFEWEKPRSPSLIWIRSLS